MTRVYMDPAVGGDGNTYSDDADPQTTLANDGHRIKLMPLISALLSIAQWIKTAAATVSGYASSALASATAAAGSATTAGGSATAAAGSANSAATSLAQVQAIANAAASGPVITVNGLGGIVSVNATNLPVGTLQAGQCAANVGGALVGIPVDGNVRYVSGPTVAAARDVLRINTSAGPVPITLPPNPAKGDWVLWFDDGAAFAKNPCTFLRNGRLIDNIADDIQSTTAYDSGSFMYDGASWRLN
jgi:hypothetical protein